MVVSRPAGQDHRTIELALAKIDGWKTHRNHLLETSGAGPEQDRRRDAIKKGQRWGWLIAT